MIAQFGQVIEGAVVSYQGTLEISTPGKVVNLSTTAGTSMSIKYDGLSFTISAVSGDVYINNFREQIVLRGSSVCEMGRIAIDCTGLGEGHRGFARLRRSELLDQLH